MLSMLSMRYTLHCKRRVRLIRAKRFVVILENLRTWLYKILKSRNSGIRTLDLSVICHARLELGYGTTHYATFEALQTMTCGTWQHYQRLRIWYVWSEHVNGIFKQCNNRNADRAGIKTLAHVYSYLFFWHIFGLRLRWTSLACITSVSCSW